MINYILVLKSHSEVKLLVEFITIEDLRDLLTLSFLNAFISPSQTSASHLSPSPATRWPTAPAKGTATAASVSQAPQGTDAIVQVEKHRTLNYNHALF